MDLWRGQLSLRRLSVLVAHLPVGSAVWSLSADVPYGWTLTDTLLADIFQGLTGERHPLRPDNTAKEKAKKDQDRVARLKAQRVRDEARRRMQQAQPPPPLAPQFMPPPPASE